MISNIKIILVEDEPYNLRLLEGMIKKLRSGWEVVKTLESVKSSVEWLCNNPHPDLFFMDIQLADGLCFSIFDQVEVKGMSELVQQKQKITRIILKFWTPFAKARKSTGNVF
jgi:CheY-like chemotaxis protein